MVVTKLVTKVVTLCFQGGNYVLVLTAGQYDMVKASFTGINVKPTTDKSGKMTFRLNESQWQQFQANQAKAAAGQGNCVSKCLCVCLCVKTCVRLHVSAILIMFICKFAIICTAIELSALGILSHIFEKMIASI